jgi:hypothetical protein
LRICSSAQAAAYAAERIYGAGIVGYALCSSCRLPRPDIISETNRKKRMATVEQVITQIKGIDMPAVQREIAERGAEG